MANPTEKSVDIASKLFKDDIYWAKITSDFSYISYPLMALNRLGYIKDSDSYKLSVDLGNGITPTTSRKIPIFSVKKEFIFKNNNPDTLNLLLIDEELMRSKIITNETFKEILL